MNYKLDTTKHKTLSTFSTKSTHKHLLILRHHFHNSPRKTPSSPATLTKGGAFHKKAPLGCSPGRIIMIIIKKRESKKKEEARSNGVFLLC
jgi:hypothetical protein